MEKESDGERQLTTLDTTRTNFQPELVVTVGNVEPKSHDSASPLLRRKISAII